MNLQVQHAVEWAPLVLLELLEVVLLLMLQLRHLLN